MHKLYVVFAWCLLSAMSLAPFACTPKPTQVQPRRFAIASLTSSDTAKSPQLETIQPPTSPRITSQGVTTGFNLRQWINEKGVKLVVVHFNEKNCTACETTDSLRRSLERNYGAREFRFIAVDMAPPPDSVCPQLPGNHRTLCMPELAARFGVEQAPAMFVWSWQGELLVNHERRNTEVERHIRRYLDNLPRVQVSIAKSLGQAASLYSRQIEETLARTSKLQVLTDSEMRKRLALLRKKSHGPGRIPGQEIDPGVGLSPNSILRAEVHKGTLSLLLADAASERLIETHSESWVPGQEKQTLQHAVATLVGKLKFEPIEMPGGSRPPLRDLETGELAFLEALSLDFRQKRHGKAQAIQTLYSEACTQKVGSACLFQDWHFTSGGHFVKARDTLQPRCESGDPLACIVVGWSLSQTRPTGLPSVRGKNPRKAAALFSKACDMGISLGCVELGRLQVLGAGIPLDEPSALVNFQRSCAHDAGRGCVSLAWVHAKGLGVPGNSKQAFVYADKACQSNVPEGCVMTGLMRLHGDGAGKDFGKALQDFISACESGYAHGCINAGRLYEGHDAQNEEGRIRANKAEAVKWLTRGCTELHDARSCTNLGMTLCNPDEAEQSDSACSQAEPLLFQACKTGKVAHACRELASLYEKGRLTVSDDKRMRALYGLASGLFETGCRQGEAKACLESAALFAKGVPGVPKNATRADETLRRACKLGARDPRCQGAR